MKFQYLLLSLLLLFVTPIFAQETTTTPLTDEEIALVEEVQAVYDSFNTLDAVGLDVTQHVDQVIEFQGESLTQSIHITMKNDSVLSEGITTAFQVEMTQTIESDGISGELSMVMIYVDDELYANVTSASPIFADLFPEGWQSASENPEILGLTGDLDLDALSQVGLEFTPELIKSIAEIDVPEDVEAERAIAVSLLPNILEEQSFLSDIYEGLIGEEADAEQKEAMLTLLSSAVIDLYYYFDADNVLVRSDLTLHLVGDFGMLVGADGLILDQTLTQSAIYRYYDEAPVITAPEIE